MSDDLDEVKATDALNRIMAVRALIVANGAKRKSTGELECPICNKGVVHWSMASNGHIHAGCTTDGCVRWME